MAAQAGDASVRGGADLGIGLQLVRASNLTMTRLHLALQSGDRRLAMMAMDGLLDIDAEMEGFVADLVERAGDDPHDDAHWQALSGYLAHQKAAIAVEKHALVAVLEEFPAASPPQPPLETEEEAWAEEGARRGPAALIIVLLLCALLAAGAGVAFGLGWLPQP